MRLYEIARRHLWLPKRNANGSAPSYDSGMPQPPDGCVAKTTRLANACNPHEEKLVVWTLLDTGILEEINNLGNSRLWKRRD